MFHLFTHAFFKSLLFKASGSVNHAPGTFAIAPDGRPAQDDAWTYATFLIGSLSLAGIWPLAGSGQGRDTGQRLESQPVLFALASSPSS
jgi:NADH-quinone oxidoreductase subunit L